MAALAAATWIVPATSAAAANPILTECTTGHLSGHYSLAQLRHALKIMPGSLRQYTSCPDVIQNAIVTAQHPRSGAPGTSSGGSFLPTPVLIVLIVLVLAALTFGGLALRRRRGAEPPGQPPEA